MAKEISKAYELYRVVVDVPWGFALEKYTDDLAYAEKVRAFHTTTSVKAEIQVHIGNGIYTPLL